MLTGLLIIFPILAAIVVLFLRGKGARNTALFSVLQNLPFLFLYLLSICKILPLHYSPWIVPGFPVSAQSFLLVWMGYRSYLFY